MTALKPKEKEEFKEIDNYIFGDFETAGLGGNFIIAATLDENDNFETYKTIEDFMMAVINSSKVIYFHNLEYDARYILDYLIKHKIKFEVITRVTKVLIIKCENCEFVDTYAVLSDSLANLSKVFAPEYEKKKLDLDKETFNPENEEHMEYLRYDVLALKHVYLNARRVIYENFGINMKYTAASCALEAFRLTLNSPLYRTNQKAENIARKAYSGGFVYIREVNVFSDIYVLDYNSMYPSVMRDNDIPTGRVVLTKKYMGKGYYKVILDQSKAKFKFIYGYTDDEKRKLQPQKISSDKFLAYISDVEYELAIELGYNIEIIEGIHFEQSDKIFTTFVNMCEELRLKNNKNAVGAMTKLIQNSLYGKFGSKKKREKYVLDTEALIGYQPLLIDNLPSDLQYKEEEINRSYMLPHIAAYVTACARAKLVRAIIKAGIENVVYCDTDSLFVTKDGYEKLKDEIGVKYGMLKLEAQLEEVLLLAPKLYFDKNGKKNSIKGFPKKKLEQLYNMIMSGKEPVIQFAGLNSCRNIMRNNTSFGKTISRSINKIPDHIFERVNSWYMEE